MKYGLKSTVPEPRRLALPLKVLGMLLSFKTNKTQP